jgi:hypothetical protein
MYPRFPVYGPDAGGYSLEHNKDAAGNAVELANYIFGKRFGQNTEAESGVRDYLAGVATWKEAKKDFSDQFVPVPEGMIKCRGDATVTLAALVNPSLNPTTLGYVVDKRMRARYTHDGSDADRLPGVIYPCDDGAFRNVCSTAEASTNYRNFVGLSVLKSSKPSILFAGVCLKDVVPGTTVYNPQIQPSLFPVNMKSRWYVNPEDALRMMHDRYMAECGRVVKEQNDPKWAFSILHWHMVPVLVVAEACMVSNEMAQASHLLYADKPEVARNSFRVLGFITFGTPRFREVISPSSIRRALMSSTILCMRKVTLLMILRRNPLLAIINERKHARNEMEKEGAIFCSHVELAIPRLPEVGLADVEFSKMAVKMQKLAVQGKDPTPAFAQAVCRERLDSIKIFVQLSGRIVRKVSGAVQTSTLRVIPIDLLRRIWDMAEPDIAMGFWAQMKSGL